LPADGTGYESWPDKVAGITNREKSNQEVRLPQQGKTEGRQGW